MDIETFSSWLNGKSMVFIHEIQAKLKEVHAPQNARLYFDSQQIEIWYPVEVKNDLLQLGIII